MADGQLIILFGISVHINSCNSWTA